MIGLCDNCALKYADCKGNKDLEKTRCDYFKKPIVMNVKELAERVAELEIMANRYKWVPVSERLPNNDGCVLVTIDDGIEFGKYEDGSWSIWVCEHWDKWDAKGTIAWQPLPKPYREDGEV